MLIMKLKNMGSDCNTSFQKSYAKEVFMTKNPEMCFKIFVPKDREIETVKTLFSD